MRGLGAVHTRARACVSGSQTEESARLGFPKRSQTQFLGGGGGELGRILLLFHTLSGAGRGEGGGAWVGYSSFSTLSPTEERGNAVGYVFCLKIAGISWATYPDFWGRAGTMAGDAVDPADLAKGSTDFRYLLTQNRVPEKFQVTLFRAGIDTVAKFSASFKDEADLKSVLAKDFSIEPEASLMASRALAAAFVVAWRAAQARTREQADREAASEMREWAKPIPQTEYMAMRQAFAQKFGEPEDKHVPAKEYIERKLHELETGVQGRALERGAIQRRD